MSRASRPATAPRPATAARRALRRRLSRTRHRLDDGRVALTFDDGPGDHTHRVLDVLAAHRVPATFFVVGRNAERAPDLVARIRDEGHGLGSHTLTHPDPATLPVPTLWREVRDGRRAVEEVAGRPVPLFRPPHGHPGRLGSVVARATRVQPWLWTRDPEDWRPDTGADDLLDRLRPVGGGDVVVLHDGLEQPQSPHALDRSATVAALDRFLTEAVDAGLRFATLDGARP